MTARRSKNASETSGAARDPLAGTPYRALGELGRGGMGEVLEAEHQALRKRVVVKLLRRELADDPRFADRLRLEAQALAAVSSPHVVNVTDLGQTPEGRAYLVLERLEGRTLREELTARGPLPVEEAIGLVRQVLAGLAAAHRLGIVHRDVKPENVFVCAPRDGAPALVKVLDFGVAKVLDGEAASARVAGPEVPTEQGMVVGSPRTVSPEQVRCQKVDARTDVYAAGLLLYTLIVGQGPFAHARHVVEVLDAHLRETPAPPSRRAPQRIPPALDRAVLKALAKRPEHRFQSAEEFSGELGRIAAALAGAEEPLPSPGDGAVDDEVEAWFVPLASLPVIAEPAEGLDAPRARPDPRVFALITLVSTLVFSLIAALIWLRLRVG